MDRSKKTEAVVRLLPVEGLIATGSSRALFPNLLSQDFHTVFIQRIDHRDVREISPLITPHQPTTNHEKFKQSMNWVVGYLFDQMFEKGSTVSHWKIGLISTTP